MRLIVAVHAEKKTLKAPVFAQSALNKHYQTHHVFSTGKSIDKRSKPFRVAPRIKFTHEPVRSVVHALEEIPNGFDDFFGPSIGQG
jgi:hypothetical protein